MALYLLHLYRPARAVSGRGGDLVHQSGQVFGLPSVGAMWLVYLLLLVPLYYPTKWFAELKPPPRPALAALFLEPGSDTQSQRRPAATCGP